MCAYIHIFIQPYTDKYTYMYSMYLCYTHLMYIGNQNISDLQA